MVDDRDVKAALQIASDAEILAVEAAELAAKACLERGKAVSAARRAGWAQSVPRSAGLEDARNAAFAAAQAAQAARAAAEDASAVAFRALETVREAVRVYKCARKDRQAAELIDRLAEDVHKIAAAARTAINSGIAAYAAVANASIAALLSQEAELTALTAMAENPLEGDQADSETMVG